MCIHNKTLKVLVNIYFVWKAYFEKTELDLSKFGCISNWLKWHVFVVADDKIENLYNTVKDALVLRYMQDILNPINLYAHFGTRSATDPLDVWPGSKLGDLSATFFQYGQRNVIIPCNMHFVRLRWTGSESHVFFHC